MLLSKTKVLGWSFINDGSDFLKIHYEIMLSKLYRIYNSIIVRPVSISLDTIVLDFCGSDSGDRTFEQKNLETSGKWFIVIWSENIEQLLI